jgi:hypothetical protein
MNVSRRRTYRSRAQALAMFLILVGLQLTAMHGSAWALTEIRGQQDDLQLSAKDASIKEILDALATSQKLRYKLPPNLRVDLTVQCSGTLRQILERVLDGNDYILKVFDDAIEVVVLGNSGAVAVVSSAPLSTANKSTNVSTANSTPGPSTANKNTNVSTAGSTPGPVLPETSAAPPLTSFLSQGTASDAR